LRFPGGLEPGGEVAQLLAVAVQLLLRPLRSVMSSITPTNKRGSPCSLGRAETVTWTQIGAPSLRQYRFSRVNADRFPSASSAMSSRFRGRSSGYVMSAYVRDCNSSSL